MVKIFFQTHGCSTNFSETEVMKGILQSADFKIVENQQEANIIVINICTVKGEVNALKEIKKITGEIQNQKMVVAGCITKEIVPLIREINPDASFVNTHNITRIVEIMEEVSHGNVMEALTKEYRLNKIGLPRIRKNTIIGIVPILSGCVFNCSYCSVKWIKGHLYSYPKDLILKEVQQCVREGCKEIWITSQDNAGYDLEVSNKSTLPELLNEICAINGDFFVRLGMMNPTNVLYFLDELIEVYKNKKLFKFLHLPVQSGSDKILEVMNRKYKVDDYKSIVSEFRKKIPKITLSTDVIVGFPTETDSQFNDTVDLIREIKPDVLNLSRFMPRPNTKAASMPQLAGGVIKDRSRLMTDIFGNIAKMKNEEWLGWKGEILMDEEGKNGTFIGRNFAYKPVVIAGETQIGEVLKVTVDKVTSYDLRGTVITDHS